MNARPVPSLALLAGVTALAFCALHMVVPALPLLVAVFDDSAARVQLVLSLYLAGIAAGQRREAQADLAKAASLAGAKDPLKIKAESMLGALAGKRR